MIPEIKNLGVRLPSGMNLEYGFAATPFGTAVTVSHGEALVALEFCDRGEEAAVRSLSDEFPEARLTRDDRRAERIVAGIIDGGSTAIRIEVCGSPFRIAVWEQMLRLKEAETISYSQLAARCGCPRAVRAVASAVAANPIGWIIPCHRIVRSDGSIGRFRWTPARKCAMIEWEKARNR